MENITADGKIKTIRCVKATHEDFAKLVQLGKDQKKALETFQANHTDIQIQDMQIYVKADDNCAYIVVNGTEYPDDKILL